MITNKFDMMYKEIPYDSNNIQGFYEKVLGLNKQFAVALAQEYLPGQSEKLQSKVFEMAWAEGHASGYSEVEDHYQDFADLAIFAIKNAKES